MSMLSAQCDKLRETAELVEGHGKVGFGVLIITDPLMVDAAKEMRDAADTIWRLRDDLQRANAENAKLRELMQELYEDQCDECNRWKYRDRMRELGVEVD